MPLGRTGPIQTDLLVSRQALVELFNLFMLFNDQLAGHGFELRRFTLPDFGLCHLDAMLMMGLHQQREILVGIPDGCRPFLRSLWLVVA